MKNMKAFYLTILPSNKTDFEENRQINYFTPMVLSLTFYFCFKFLSRHFTLISASIYFIFRKNIKSCMMNLSRRSNNRGHVI